MTELESTGAAPLAKSGSHHYMYRQGTNSANFCSGSSVLLTGLKTHKDCGSPSLKFLYWNDSKTDVGVAMANSILKDRKMVDKKKVGPDALVRPIPVGDPKNGVFTFSRNLGGFLGIDSNGSLILQTGIDRSSATSFLLVEVWCQENKISYGLANHCKIAMCARRAHDTSAFLIASPTCSSNSIKIADGEVCKNRKSFLSAINSTCWLKDAVFNSCHQFVRMNPAKHREWLRNDLQCS